MKQIFKDEVIDVLGSGEYLYTAGYKPKQLSTIIAVLRRDYRWNIRIEENSIGKYYRLVLEPVKLIDDIRDSKPVEPLRQHHANGIYAVKPPVHKPLEHRSKHKSGWII
jgi:hypothetical protein